ncbi:MAG: hypothetical protein INH12_30105 [Cupriavidus sp.]|nr:HeH/LEM domain-containing protein [Cupriavidus sp.]MCA3183914.1 hypothetical protein [Cupriavidus sp.]MCA3194324.1 hypothetical protein [Cupriavidus sp.]MCA3200432.1 hypothetical protein [Cupriavidus sp.]MCA3233696.1 hypothetical protein [Cupriavidus sp.]
MQLETVRVVAPETEDNDQGFIVINKSDLTDEHELYVEATDAPRKLGIAELRAALTEKGIEFDADAKKADLQKLLDAANQG